MRSFDAELAEALRRRRLHRRRWSTSGSGPGEAEELDDDGSAAEPAQPFFTAPLPPGRRVARRDLDQLIEFFGHRRALLRRRLGVRLARADVELADDEPFVADLPRAAPALRACCRRCSAAPAGRRAAARDRRHRTAGRRVRARRSTELGALAGFAERLRAPLRARAPPVAVALDIDAAGRRWHLHGHADRTARERVVGYRFDELRAHEALRAWLQHLLLCATAPAVPRAQHLGRSRRDGRAGHCARRRASDWRNCWNCMPRAWSGRSRFYPKAAWAFASQGWKLSAARSKWNGSPFTGFDERKGRRLAVWHSPADLGTPAVARSSAWRGPCSSRCWPAGGV